MSYKFETHLEGGKLAQLKNLLWHNVGASEIATTLTGAGQTAYNSDAGTWHGYDSVSSVLRQFLTSDLLDTDVGLAANSDSKLATQRATKAYIDSRITSAMAFQGGFDASGNPANFPTSTQAGEVYVVSAAGTIAGEAVEVGDTIYSIGVGNTTAEWEIVQANISAATETSAGIMRFATTAEAAAGTLTNVAVTPAGLAAFIQSASETVAGIIEIATQGEVDAGTDHGRAVTPLTLKGKIDALRHTSLLGDGSATSITINHNLCQQYPTVQLIEVSSGSMVMADTAFPDANNVTFTFLSAPGSNTLRVVATAA